MQDVLVGEPGCCCRSRRSGDGVRHLRIDRDSTRDPDGRVLVLLEAPARRLTLECGVGGGRASTGRRGDRAPYRCARARTSGLPPKGGKPPPVGVRRRRTFAEPRHAPCLWSVASEQPASAGRARLRLSGAVAHEQPAATSRVILFTRCVHGRAHPRKLAAVRVRRDVHCFEELF